ncbi:MAG TPA: metallophosphoesterase [Rhodoblastus sp.]|nr:metallophosphoesterase [Rhodoblastus sp.]
MNRQFLSADEVTRILEGRLGRLHARQRMGIEGEHEAQVFGQGLTFFHLENLPGSAGAIEALLKLSGLYGRGRENAARVELRENRVASARIPKAFDGFRLLHLSDLHADISPEAMTSARALVATLDYDLCVLTGDYRGQTHGPYLPTLEAMADLIEALRGEVFGVLGNHDSIRMTPDLERMGVRMLLNEHVAISRGDEEIFVIGVDDAHFFRVDNLEKAADGVSEEAFSILLSHTPEIYRQAAHAGFDLMLSGHTHGGQICLPGGFPVTLEAHLPRRMGRGAWVYGDMAGYTSAGCGSSVVPVRFNCPPEITLHKLVRLG